MKYLQDTGAVVAKRYSSIPKLVLGESLSVYLIRLAHENGVYLPDVLYNVAKNDLQQIYKSIISGIDIDPRRIIDVEALQKLTGVTDRDVLQMSFCEAVLKFPSCGSSETPASARISLLIEKSNRRFCPLCLHEKGAFDLLWQVKEITMCSQHKSQLLDHCGFCGAPQSYASHSLIVEGRCEACGADLSKSGAIFVDKSESQRQERRYRDWMFMTQETPKEEVVSLGTSQDDLILAALYHGQDRSERFFKDSIRNLHPHFVSRLLWAMKVRYQKDAISVPKLLDFLRATDLELREFVSTVVPNSYKESVYAYLKKQPQVHKANKCLAPWCRYYKQTNGMRALKRTKKRFEYSHEEFSDLHVCTGCFCVFGHSLNGGEWKEISDLISMGYERIRPHLNQLDPHKGIRSISEEFGITKRRATRLTAYLMYYELVNPTIRRRFIPKDVPSAVVDKFRYMDQIGGQLDESAKELYGWNLFEYFYFRSSPEVMHYLYLESKRDKKKSKYKPGHARHMWEEKLMRYLDTCEEQGLFPTTKSAAEALSCSQSLLRSKGLLHLISKTQQKLIPMYEEQLRKRVEEYLRITPIDELARERCISSLGTTRNTLKRNHPEFYFWFQKRFDEHIGQCRMQKFSDMIERIPDIINQLAISGEPVTQENVSNILGISMNVFARVLEVGEAYREAAVTVFIGDKECGERP